MKCLFIIKLNYSSVLAVVVAHCFDSLFDPKKTPQNIITTNYLVLTELIWLISIVKRVKEVVKQQEMQKHGKLLSPVQWHTGDKRRKTILGDSWGKRGGQHP